MSIYDPIDNRAQTAWFPANSETSLLVAALLACKDVARSLDGLATDPMADYRGLSMLATPALSLLTNTVALQKATSQKDKSSWPVRDRNALIDWGRRLRKLRNGPLKELRNTLSAHHDPSVLSSTATSVPTLSPLILQAVSESLCVLILLLNHQDVFAWSRQADSDNTDLIQIFQSGMIMAPTVRMESNEIRELVKLTMTSDPRDEAQDVVRETLERYNLIAQKAHLPRVDLIESNGPPRNESR